MLLSVSKSSLSTLVTLAVQSYKRAKNNGNSSIKVEVAINELKREVQNSNLPRIDKKNLLTRLDTAVK